MCYGLRVNAPYKARLTKQITKKINGMQSLVMEQGMIVTKLQSYDYEQAIVEGNESRFLDT